MRGLDGMIRLHKSVLDERQREMADLLNQLNAIEAEDQRILEEMEQEKTANPESLAQINFGAYVDGMRVKRQALDMATTQINEAIDAKRDEIGAVFQELKRFETIRARRIAQAQQDADKREQAALDEIGQQGYRRRKETG